MNVTAIVKVIGDGQKVAALVVPSAKVSPDIAGFQRLVFHDPPKP